MTDAEIYEIYKKGLLGGWKHKTTKILFQRPRSTMTVEVQTYTLTRFEDKWVVTYQPVPTSSLGVTSRGTISARTYRSRPKDETVDKCAIHKGYMTESGEFIEDITVG